MRILAVDTATRSASVALVDDDKVLAEEIHDKGPPRKRRGSAPALKGNHAEILVPLIESIFLKSGSSFDDIRAIAVSIGPGSFTGLRIGLATVKGLAYQNNLPIVGVSTLEATALRVEESAGCIAALLDARKSEVYMALFSRAQAALTRLTEDTLTSVNRAVKILHQFAAAQPAPIVLIGDGASAYEETLSDSLGASARFVGNDDMASVAACVGRLGARRLEKNSGEDLAAVAPLYLRSSEAESKLRNLV